MGQPLEKLQVLGDYGLVVEKSYPVRAFPNPDGYGPVIRTADSRGLKSWQLTNESLHSDSQLTNCLVTMEDGSQLTPHEYYWRFFDNHHEPEVVPFIITCPEDNRDYIVIFAEHKRSLRYIQWKLWSTGIRIVQFRGGDLSLGELGEVSQPNPQEI